MQGLMDNDALQLVTTASMKSGNNWGTGVICYNPVTQKILMAKRTDTHNWCTAGGKVEVGESPLQGVTRECLEESNVLLKDVIFYAYGAHTSENGKNWVSFMFLSTNFDDSDIKSQATEVEQWQWFSVQEALMMDLFPPTRKSIETAMDMGLFYNHEMSPVDECELNGDGNGDTVCGKTFSESEMPRVADVYAVCGHREDPIPSYSYCSNQYPPVWD